VKCPPPPPVAALAAVVVGAGASATGPASGIVSVAAPLDAQAATPRARRIERGLDKALMFRSRRVEKSSSVKRAA
jgi:hypothetical protein